VAGALAPPIADLLAQRQRLLCNLDAFLIAAQVMEPPALSHQHPRLSGFVALALGHREANVQNGLPIVGMPP
jgi:hypothetical protein